MSPQISLRAFALIVALASTSFAFAGEKESLSTVNFLVLKEFNGKPLRNASVILHPVDKDGKQKATGAQLKTDSTGKTSYPGIPFGKVRVQVIAPGYQTFGEDFVINKDTHDIEIKMKRPQEQYSIYEKKK
jgi:hypothetical protein